MECTSHKSILRAIYVPKLSTFVIMTKF